MSQDGRHSPDPPTRQRTWDERFAGEEYAYGKDPNEFLASVADRIPPGRVLCLAEGEGRNAVFLAERGYAVTAVDSSGVGLAKARRLAAERGVTIETVQADLEEFVIEPGAWHGIVSIWAHLLRPVRARVHAAVVRGLAPGGVFILEAYTPAQLKHGTGGPPVVERLVELSSLRDELAGLELEIGRETAREVHEGRLHHGLSAVVQVVGVRRT
jgi:SAM-dependent methyltransferase